MIQPYCVFLHAQIELEAKQGMSKLEQVCEEINEAERAKQERRALKKQKRKARKKNKGAVENGDTASQKGGVEQNGVSQEEIKCEVISNVCQKKLPGHQWRQ